MTAHPLRRLTLFEAMTAPIFERERIERETKKPLRTYSIVSDDRQSGWYDPGYGVRNNQTGCLVNNEPIETEAKANRFLEALEDGVEL